ncbi:mycocerosic acid synthase-like [Haliotis asinina]|uniref:mycocerosic acid synthase-like n=1 Tax=Haliotis asinina TaxID=109174 RepID=UPI0035322F84
MAQILVRIGLQPVQILVRIGLQPVQILVRIGLQPVQILGRIGLQPVQILKQQTAKKMDIAIIGVGCRFPGASCLREFWRVLVKGENHVTDIPPDRWNMSSFYDPDVTATGKFYSRKAGFLENYADFDNKLFGISESEAGQMDPQQRQVLECTYMTLENAGITRQHIAGQNVGVYIGAMNSDFTVRMTANSHEIDHYSVAGLAGSVLANRVSYVYNLSGPSMVVDTACSSSLVAIHQASLALRAGDCEMALCGGVNLLLHPTVFVPLSKAQMLSPSGQCHAFSSNADGYTRGEGCGMVLIKPLAQALHDGDNIWATVSTGVNQDGRAAQPITAPSGNQQLQLLHDLYRAHDVDPYTVEYIEAHGTGTKLGDPIEVNAFGEFFTSDRNPRTRYMGSVKTNIGHLEPAAGVAGLIKVLLMMKHNTIVPSLHFDKPNEHINFENFRFIIPQDPLQWTSVTKVACLNSFGFGGTNSHAVLHSFNKPPHASRPILGASHIVCFSGSTSESLKKSLEDFLSCDDFIDDDLPAMSYTSTVRREHFTHRKSFVVKSINDLKQQVQMILKSRDVADIKTSKLKIIFVFCGMGTAWSGMCDGFMKKNKTFSTTINTIDASLKKFVSWSLTERLRNGYDVQDPNFGPIAIFACQVALAKQWESWGVSPAAVVGQSVGEVAAAHVAGILSLDEAVKVIFHRTRILAEVTGGKMVLIRNLKTEKVQDICEEAAGVNIAIRYSPVSCTISGDSTAVDEVKSRLQSSHSDLMLTDLPVSAAYHSHHMDRCTQQLDNILADLKPSPARIHMISTAASRPTEKDVTSSEYWGANVRNAVQFASGIENSTSVNHLNVFIEIGPKPVLRAHIDDIFQERAGSCICLPSLTVKLREKTILGTLSELYQMAMNINWRELFSYTEPPTPVPSYAFSHKHLMILPPITEEEVFGSNGNSGSHLFVKLSPSTGKCILNIKPSNFGTVYEHKVKDIIVIPGATYVEAGFGIARSMNIADVRHLVVSVSFLNPVTLKKDVSVQLDAVIEDQSQTTNDCTKEFTIKSTGDVIAKGRMLVCHNELEEERMDIEAIKERCIQTVTGEEVYQVLQYSGFTYGTNFATVHYALRGNAESLTSLTVGQKLKEEMTHTVIHPAILDGMLQSAAAFDMQEREFLPVELKNVIVRHPVETDMFVYTRITDSNGSHTSFTLTLLSPNGTVIAHVERFTTQFIGSDTFDIHKATFKTSMVLLDSCAVPQNSVDTGTVVFTNADLTSVETSCVIHELDHMGVEGTRHALDSVIHNIKQICFVFAAPDIKTDRGESLQEELTRRIMALRLIALYLASRGVSVPLVIISEIETTGDTIATGCLSEAVKGFIRCVLREYRALHVQLVDVLVDNDRDFLERLPGILPQCRSDDFKRYPEIVLHNDQVYMHTIMSYPCLQPTFRSVIMDERSEGMLCTKSKTSITKPFFYPKQKTATSMKDMTDIEVTSVVVHSSLMHGLHIGCPAGSTVDIHPILCLETIGKLPMGSRRSHPDAITLFPSNVCKSIQVPKDCTIDAGQVPGYAPGHLTTLYLMWNLSINTARNNIVILYTNSSKPFANALSYLLLSQGAKKVSLANLNDTAQQRNDSVTLIPTVLLTKVEAKRLLTTFTNVLKIICFEPITKRSAQEYLLAALQNLQLHIIRPFEIFSPRVMSATVPKMIKWITSHSKTVFNICHSFSGITVSKKEQTAPPLNISEVLNSTVLSLSSDSSLDMDSMVTPSTHLFQKTASYLVVGGLTGLGWECVTFLAARGAGCVIILSRRTPNPERQADMDHLSQKHKCHITSIQADVTVYKGLESAVLKIKTHMKPLKGVFYGAAVLQDASLSEMTEEKLATAMSPKVTGAWNLHILTADLPLDFFVLHSSGAAVLGNAGQSNYGAGNGFLDGLAVYRRQRGMSGQSINWGPLDLGMLENKGSVLRKLESQGYMIIGKKDISQCLTHMLMLNEPQALVCRIDRQKMAEQLQRDKETTLMVRLKTYLEPAMKIINQKATSEGGKCSFSVDKLQRCTEEEKLQMLREYVKHLVCDKALLDINSFQMDANMKDQGVDSMYAMEVTGGILSDIGVKLSTHEIQLQSTNSIARRILDILSGTGKEQTQVCDMESVITKQAISMSIAKSICGMKTNCEHNMGFVIISTISVPDVVNVSTLIAVAKECVSRHQVTRTSYILSHNKVSTNMLPLEDAFDFRVLSGDDLSEVRKHTEESMHLRHKSPLRFIFLTRSLQLRIVFHRLAFDLKAITIFVKELESMANAALLGKPLEDVVTDPDEDVAKEIQKVLAPDFKRVNQFWKTKAMCIPYNSLSKAPVIHNLQNNHIFLTRPINSHLYTKILKYAKDRGLTPFDYLASIYQLFLAFVSRKTTSTITTSVDLRSLVPALTRTLGRCTNFIPLICQVPEDNTTVEEFLQHNKKTIQHFTQYAIYPSDEIKKLIPEDKSLGPNYFIYETDTITNTSNQLTVDMPVVFDSSIETFMYIWQRKETRLMEIRFHLRKDLFTNPRAEVLVKAFLGLMDDSLNFPDSTLGHLRQQNYMALDERSSKKRVLSALCSLM